MVHLASVANQLHPSDDLSDCEKPEHLGENYSTSDDLRTAYVPYPVDSLVWRNVCGSLGCRSRDGRGVAGGVENRAEVVLECL